MLENDYLTNTRIAGSGANTRRRDFQGQIQGGGTFRGEYKEDGLSGVNTRRRDYQGRIQGGWTIRGEYKELGLSGVNTRRRDYQG